MSHPHGQKGSDDHVDKVISTSPSRGSPALEGLFLGPAPPHPSDDQALQAMLHMDQATHCSLGLILHGKGGTLLPPWPLSTVTAAAHLSLGIRYRFCHYRRQISSDSAISGKLFPLKSPQYNFLAVNRNCSLKEFSSPE